MIVWTERGGSPVVEPSASTGFWSELMRRSMAQLLGGDLVVDRAPESSVVTLNMRRNRLYL